MVRKLPSRRDCLCVVSMLAALATLWFCLNARPRRTVSLEEDEFCWTLSPDRTVLVTGTVKDNCLTGPLRLRDVSTGRVRSTVFQQCDKLGPVWFSPDGKLLLIRNDDSSPSGRVKLVDAATGTEYANVCGRYGVGSPDGRYLAFAIFPEGAGPQEQTSEVKSKAGVRYGSDSLRQAQAQVKLWDVAQAREVATLRTGVPGGFSPDGRTLLTFKQLESDEYELSLWDVATGHLRGSFRIPLGSMESCFSPNGQSFVASWYGASGPNGMKLVDVATAQELTLVVGANSPVFIHGGKTLAACQAAFINCWDAATGQKTGTLAVTGPAGSRAYHLEISADGRWLIVVVSRDAPSRWSPLVARWPVLGTWLQVPSSYSKLQVLDAATGSEVAAFPPKRVLGFTPDGEQLALGRTRTIEFWDLPPRKSIAEFLAWSGLIVFVVLAVRCRLKSVATRNCGSRCA